MFLLRALTIRVGGLVAADLVATFWLSRLGLNADPHAAELEAYALLPLAAFAWGMHDGARRAAGAVAQLWAAGALLHALVALAVAAVVQGRWPDWGSGPIGFLTFVVLAPAGLGAACGLLLARLPVRRC